MAETGLARLIKAGYRLLDLITFFTSGPKETRAWTVEQGTKAPAAAGQIHSDFERGFIRAETISYVDFMACGGGQSAREAGRDPPASRGLAVPDRHRTFLVFHVLAARAEGGDIGVGGSGSEPGT